MQKYLKVKGKVEPTHAIETYKGVEIQLHSFLTSALRGCITIQLS